MTDTARDLRENFPPVDVTAVVFSRDFSGIGCCVIPQDRVLAIADEIERLQAQVHELAAGTGPAIRGGPSPGSAAPHYREAFEAAWNKRPWLTEEESDKDRAWRWWQAAIASRWEDKREGKPANAVDSAPSDCTTVSDGRRVAGGMQMSATEGANTRRPAHPKDTISGGPIGPSDPSHNVIIEVCANVALEQRCERGTPWDLACTAIAEKIRALSVSSRAGCK